MRAILLFALLAACTPQNPSGSYTGDYWYVATGGATGAGSIEMTIDSGYLNVTDGCDLDLVRIGEQEIDNLHKSSDDYEFFERVEPGATCAFDGLSFTIDNGNMDVIDHEQLTLEAGGPLASGGYIAFNFSGVGVDE